MEYTQDADGEVAHERKRKPKVEKNKNPLRKNRKESASSRVCPKTRLDRPYNNKDGHKKWRKKMVHSEYKRDGVHA